MVTGCGIWGDRCGGTTRCGAFRGLRGRRSITRRKDGERRGIAIEPGMTLHVGTRMTIDHETPIVDINATRDPTMIQDTATTRDAIMIHSTHVTRAQTTRIQDTIDVKIAVRGERMMTALVRRKEGTGVDLIIGKIRGQAIGRMAMAMLQGIPRVTGNGESEMRPGAEEMQGVTGTESRKNMRN